MLAPVDVVALGKILARMGAAALLAGLGAVDRGDGVGHQVLQLQRFDQIGVPDHRAVVDLDVGEFVPDRRDAAAAVFQRFLRAEDGGVFLHGLLHLFAQEGSRRAAVGVTQPVEAVHDLVGGRLVDRRWPRSAVDHLAGPDRRGAAEHHEVDQRIGAEPVGAVHRGAAGFADGHQPGRNAIRVVRRSGSAPRPNNWSGCRPYCSGPSAAPGSGPWSRRRRQRSLPIRRCRAAAHAAPPDRDGRGAGRCGPCSCRRRGLRGSPWSCSARRRRATPGPWRTAHSAP